MTPALAASAALAIVTLCYVAACGITPFGKCIPCGGKGFLGRKTAAKGPHCDCCDGHGRCVRLGRRLYTHIKRHYRQIRRDETKETQR